MRVWSPPASHFFFKCAYSLQQRRALILSRERGAVSVDELGLKFEELRLEGRSVPQIYHRLRDVLGALSEVKIVAIELMSGMN